MGIIKSLLTTSNSKFFLEAQGYEIRGTSGKNHRRPPSRNLGRSRKPPNYFAENGRTHLKLGTCHTGNWLDAPRKAKKDERRKFIFLRYVDPELNEYFAIAWNLAQAKIHPISELAQSLFGAARTNKRGANYSVLNTCRDVTIMCSGNAGEFLRPSGVAVQLAESSTRIKKVETSQLLLRDPRDMINNAQKQALSLRNVYLYLC